MSDSADPPVRALPPPATTGRMTFGQALRHRRSIRHFTTDPLTPGQLSALCFAAQGETGASPGYRAAPSAGALLPATVFIADGAGLHEYLPDRHGLRAHSESDVRRKLQHASYGQSCVGGAAACFIIAMDPSRLARKYGSRAERYCLLEAGHIAQNILLQAVTLGLGGVPVGAFREVDVADVISLPRNLEPVYLVPVGKPAADERG